ncbi:NADH-quinone oxidoreductase subunit NuoE [Anaerovorax odorimutans]|uniref:NADH-quinone oxidoreductase subunit NuoE n=1 Tax=Anaerovorax odorimutans TaxID=109327 RepID=UPI0004105B32|nr:NADH-quinone oxidoreductase subunit NuoE [Anaerovorax odorimutans]
MQSQKETKNCTCTCSCNDDTDYYALDEILAEYKDMQGNLIIILQKAQEIYGYLSREVIRHISQVTGYTQAKIYGVATFYTQFRLAPIGKNLIMLCQGTACHVNGSKDIEEAICSELNIQDGETTEDGLFTLNNVACLGCCSLAPVMMISSSEGEETYGKLTKDSVKEILKKIKAEAEK